MPTTLRAAESTLAAIGRIADAAPSAQDLLEQAAERIGRVVPVDGSFFSATDPATVMATGTGIVNDLPHEWCRPTWEYEFLVDEPLNFRAIARSGVAVADAHDVTGGRPERSPRFRPFSADTGFRAEVRLVFGAGDAVWGIAQLNRRGDGARFSDCEKAWLARAAGEMARGLRRAMVALPAAEPSGRGSGVVVLDADGRVLSATPEAAEWLDDLHPAMADGRRADELPLPFHAPGFVARMRAARADGEPPVRARMRTRAGVWVLMHGAPLHGTDQFALIIEPAKASDIAPLIVEAYELTQREHDVTCALARGLRTDEIAARLHLSPHTVRDHIKAAFEKVGASSRGELVHKVFAEHYAPLAH